MGIYHSVSVKHLQKYVDETTFRLNESRCKAKTMDRIESMIAKNFGIVTRYKILVGTHFFEKDLITENNKLIEARRYKAKHKKAVYICECTMTVDDSWKNEVVRITA